MIYTLVGPERFLVERATARLKEERSAGLSDFNIEILRAEEVPVVKVLEALNILPLLGGRRLVMVRDIEEFSNSDLERLEPVLEGLPETTDLILTGGKVDKRIRFWQRVQKLGQFTEYRPLYAREVPGWVRQELKARGREIDPKALEVFCALSGTEIGLVVASLDRLLLAVGSAPRLTLADVERCLTTFTWKSVFDLTHALGNRRRAEALKLYRAMITSGENPVGLLALMTRHFRLLLKIRTATGVRPEDLGVPPFFFQDYQQQAKLYSPVELHNRYEQIFWADWDLKSSSLPQDMVMERLIWQLT